MRRLYLEWRLRVWRRRLLIADGRVSAASQCYGPAHVGLGRRDAAERARSEVMNLEHLLGIPVAIANA